MRLADIPYYWDLTVVIFHKDILMFKPCQVQVQVPVQENLPINKKIFTLFLPEYSRNIFPNIIWYLISTGDKLAIDIGVSYVSFHYI